MWASLRSAPSPLAIPTQDAEASILGPAGGAQITDDVLLSVGGSLSWLGVIAPINGTITIDVIQRQECKFPFPATGTATAVSVDHFLASAAAVE